ncbi:MAG: bifunctional metallophosphatase/5'-nucleotidase [Synergistaceae bacterium]|jgi:2',3'-cyclic-nucleotide 2'-phosphodiesterase (5'-nucleotidase family)|nr:bifunctional metallophosphatase/5'-nucleotidase [Synergistaceae bacterium]
MRLRKVLLKMALAALAVFLLFSVSCAAQHDLVIFHTNDVHGYAFEEKNASGDLTRVGYDRLKSIVDADESPRKLLLDAGDVLHGQAFATARRGELAALVLSMVGYDALAVGNHDFDYGQDRLFDLVGKYRLNFLAANVTRTDKKDALVLPSRLVKDFGDLKVGVFGLLTPETSTATDPRNVTGLRFADPIASAKTMVKLLKDEGVDLIIAVTHMGSEPYCKPMSQTIAAEVSGIDLIIDGHSHSETIMRVKDRDGGETLVVSTGCYFKNLGRVNVNRKEDGGFAFSAQILPASGLAVFDPDPAMREAMGVLKSELEKELGQVVMNLPFDLDGSREKVRSSSTSLGRVICASLVETTGADAAMLNGGSIRDSIASGDVTKGEMLSVLPYGNYVYLIDITGKDLISALDHGLGQPGSGAFPQFWGMEVTAKKTVLTGTDGSKNEALAVESVKIGGQPVRDDAKYVLAINDFLHAGGDGYEMFTQYEYREFATLEEVFRGFVTERDEAALRSISDARILSE